ncbi:hypothetical protein NDU88_000916 [Pleurodeles waltl]|uniref:Uncharacterized protein n=1 Tax=Pleurodeles waltl TaxID=8319 RepID=A0AAV7Q5J3_PLEWA|nr:hypothetical protein NDU88_000916 [Pleurodeles waltl]
MVSPLSNPLKICLQWPEDPRPQSPGLGSSFRAVAPTTSGRTAAAPPFLLSQCLSAPTPFHGIAGPWGHSPPLSSCAASSPLVCHRPVLVLAGQPPHSPGGRRGGTSALFSFCWELSRPQHHRQPGLQAHLRGAKWGSRPEDSRAPRGPLYSSLSSCLSVQRVLTAAAQASSPCSLAASKEVVHPAALLAPRNTSKGGQEVLATALFSSGPDAHTRPGRHTPGAHGTALAPCPAAICHRSSLLPLPHPLLTAGRHTGCFFHQAASALLRQRVGSRPPLLLAGASDAPAHAPRQRLPAAILGAARIPGPRVSDFQHGHSGGSRQSPGTRPHLRRAQMGAA